MNKCYKCGEEYPISMKIFSANKSFLRKVEIHITYPKSINRHVNYVIFLCNKCLGNITKGRKDEK